MPDTPDMRQCPPPCNLTHPTWSDYMKHHGKEEYELAGAMPAAPEPSTPTITILSCAMCGYVAQPPITVEELAAKLGKLLTNKRLLELLADALLSDPSLKGRCL